MPHNDTNPTTGDGGARQHGMICNGSDALNSQTHGPSQALRAVIIGSNQAEANGVTARGHAPVLILCRALIEAGVDPKTPLEAYRGTTLCLRVRSIGESARLTVQDSKTGRPRFVRHQQDGAEGCVAAPYVEQVLGEVRL